MRFNNYPTTLYIAGACSVVGYFFINLFGIPPILGFYVSILLTYIAFQNLFMSVSPDSPPRRSFSEISASAFALCLCVYIFIFNTHSGVSFQSWSEKMIIPTISGLGGFLALCYFLYVAIPKKYFKEPNSTIDPIPSALTMACGYILIVYGPGLHASNGRFVYEDQLFSLIAIVCILITPILYFSSFKKMLYIQGSKIGLYIKMMTVVVFYVICITVLFNIFPRYSLGCC